MRNRIELHLTRTGWTATFVGPHAAEVVRLFGTATIPTPFTAQAAGATVLRAIIDQNPGVAVDVLS